MQIIINIYLRLKYLIYIRHPKFNLQLVYFYKTYIIIYLIYYYSELIIKFKKYNPTIYFIIHP